MQNFFILQFYQRKAGYHLRVKSDRFVKNAHSFRNHNECCKICLPGNYPRLVCSKVFHSITSCCRFYTKTFFQKIIFRTKKEILSSTLICNMSRLHRMFFSANKAKFTESPHLCGTGAFNLMTGRKSSSSTHSTGQYEVTLHEL